MASSVAQGLNVSTVAELRALPPAAVAAWPDTQESADQLFPGYYMDPYFVRSWPCPWHTRILVVDSSALVLKVDPHRILESSVRLIHSSA